MDKTGQFGQNWTNRTKLDKSRKKFDLSGLKPKDEETNNVGSLGITSFTEFGKVLNQAESEDDYREVLKMLLDKGPSALDIEIRSLGPEGGGSLGLLSGFLQMLQTGFDDNRNFEMLQSYFSLFLKVHGTVIMKEKKLVTKLEQIHIEEKNSWHSLQEELDESLCLVKFFKSSFLT